MIKPSLPDSGVLDVIEGVVGAEGAAPRVVGEAAAAEIVVAGIVPSRTRELRPRGLAVEVLLAAREAVDWKWAPMAMGNIA